MYLNLCVATYSMYCFWSGETHLAKAAGVLHTESGFMDGKEVVKVIYDPSLISKYDLDAYASEGSCQKMEKGSSYTFSEKDSNYQFKSSIYKHIPLLDSQKTRINSYLSGRDDPASVLSPQQLTWLKELNAGEREKKDLSADFTQNWENM